MGSMPTQITDAQRATWRATLLGALSYLVRTPRLWWMLLVLPRLVRGLWASAWSESYMDASAVGDDGESVGVLQFHRRTWERLGGGGDRTDPGVSGAAAVAYLGAAPRRWWARLWLTGGQESLRAWRAYWVRGPQGGLPTPRDGDAGPIATEAWRRVPVEYYVAWVARALLLVPPVAALAGTLGLRSRGRRR